MAYIEETTRLEFINRITGQMNVVDSVTIRLAVQGYNKSEGKSIGSKENTILVVSVDDNNGFDENGKQIRRPYQRLSLNLANHYETPYQSQEAWYYDLTLNDATRQRREIGLDPDIFRVTREDHWVIIEWLSYTRKETYGGTSTLDSPDALISSLAIPVSNILSIQTIKKTNSLSGN